MPMKFGEGEGLTAARMAVAENATSTSRSILDIAFESLLNIGVRTISRLTVRLEYQVGGH